MYLLEAWEIVADLARENVLDPHDFAGDHDELEAAALAQDQALEILSEFFAEYFRTWPDEQKADHAADSIDARRLIARFRPQMWLNDQAMDVEGAVYFDATEKFLRLPLEYTRTFRENSYDSDELAEDLPARQHHSGPFEVDIDASEWLEQNGVPGGRDGLTQEHLDRLRAEYGMRLA